MAEERQEERTIINMELIACDSVDTRLLYVLLYSIAIVEATGQTGMKLNCFKRYFRL